MLKGSMVKTKWVNGDFLEYVSNEKLIDKQIANVIDRIENQPSNMIQNKDVICTQFAPSAQWNRENVAFGAND